MKLSVATNWDKALLDNIKDFPVYSVYGKMGSDIMGGGRPSYLLPEISQKEIKEYIEETHKRRIEFIYLLNPLCLGNKEYIADSHMEIIEYIKWVSDIGVDYVTVAIPYLLQIIKRQFPNLKVVISVFANVNSVQRAKFYESLGADVITLPEYVNRDFRLLEGIRKAVKCDIQLIANMTCLYGCPFQLYHANIVSHSSQSDHFSKGFYIDYCILNCTRAKIFTPEEVIKSRWIRPEDIHIYEEIGIDNFKIIERFDTTETISRTVQAYASRKYEGNLIDILNIKSDPKKQITVKVKYFQQPDFAKIQKLHNFEDTLYLEDQYIDNKALDGFIDFFKEIDCQTTSCEECGYCKRIAEKVFRINFEKAKKTLDKLSEKINDLISSDFFKGIKKEGIKMDWNPEVKEKFDQAIGFVDLQFQEVARKAVGREAEFNAKERGAQQVEEEDMIKAFLSITPQESQTDMRNGLKKLGIDIEKYL